MADETAGDSPQTVENAKIQQINAILESGTEQVSVDGTSTKLNHDTLRQERDRLIAADPSQKQYRKRRLSTLDLGGAW